MSDVTTYLVTNQITPTPPMPPRPGALHRPQPFVFQISSSIVTPACPSAPHLAHTPPPALVIYRTPFTVTVVAPRSRINCHRHISIVMKIKPVPSLYYLTWTDHRWALVMYCHQKKVVTFLFWTATKTNYTSKCSDFHKKLIDTFVNHKYWATVSTLKLKPYKILPQHTKVQAYAVTTKFWPSTLLLANGITIDCSAVLWLVKRSVVCQNFVLKLCISFSLLLLNDGAKRNCFPYLKIMTTLYFAQIFAFFSLGILGILYLKIMTILYFDQIFAFFSLEILGIIYLKIMTTLYSAQIFLIFTLQTPSLCRLQGSPCVVILPCKDPVKITGYHSNPSSSIVGT